MAQALLFKLKCKWYNHWKSS